MNETSLRVLVVEDHRDVRAVLGMYLVSLGYRVELARDIESALAISLDGDIDVLLTDVMLPDGDGWDLCRELRVRGYAPPVMISMSAFSTGHEAEQSVAAGCCAHFIKPFIPEALAALLEEKAAAKRLPNVLLLKV